MLEFTQVSDGETYKRWETENKSYTIAWYKWESDRSARGHKENPGYDVYYNSMHFTRNHRYDTFEAAQAVCESHNSRFTGSAFQG